jgi:peptidoglycan/xylan/chitin deacetylase (PgdA/CDA1 family)
MGKHNVRRLILGTACVVLFGAFAVGDRVLAAVQSDSARWETRDGGIVRGRKDRREIALAFTAHEFSEGGTTILDALAAHRATASFFFTGDFLDKPQAAELVRRLIKDGHYLGPHSDRHLLYCTWDGSRRTLISHETFRQDLEANLKKIDLFGISRQKVRYFVPPYEHYNKLIAGWAKEMELVLVNPTPGLLASADYTTEGEANFVSSQRIIDNILAKDRTDAKGLNGDVLLMHFGVGDKRKDKLHLRLGQLMDQLSRKGYRFVRIDELLAK